MGNLLAHAERLIKLAPRMRNDEAAVMEQLRLLVECDDLAKLLEVPPVTQYEFEFKLPGVGRPDLVLFHADGGVTLVEAKGPEDTRSLACGIGQLFTYAGAMQKMLFGGRLPTSIGMFLCAPLTADKSGAVRRACELSGVGFIQLPPAGQLKFAVANCLGVSYA